MIYAAKKNLLIICLDDDGDNWKELDVDLAGRYRDWRPCDLSFLDRLIYALLLQPWYWTAKKVSAAFRNGERTARKDGLR